MRNYRIAAMGGDGIGPEVVDAGVQALKACAERDGKFKLDFQDFDWGSDYYKKHGVMMPEDGADRLRKFDAILSAPSAPRIFRTTSRFGDCAWLFVSLLTSTPTYVQPEFYLGSPVRCVTYRALNSTG